VRTNRLPEMTEEDMRPWRSTHSSNTQAPAPSGCAARPSSAGEPQTGGMKRKDSKAKAEVKSEMHRGQRQVRGLLAIRLQSGLSKRQSIEPARKMEAPNSVSSRPAERAAHSPRTIPEALRREGLPARNSSASSSRQSR